MIIIITIIIIINIIATISTVLQAEAEDCVNANP